MSSRGFWGNSFSVVLLVLSFAASTLALIAPPIAQAQTTNARACDSSSSCNEPALSAPGALTHLSEASPAPLAPDSREKHEEAPAPSKSELAVLVKNGRPDRNREFFHKNKLEFSLETGYLPQNIPFPFDFLLGSGFNMTPLKYTLTPILASLRWQTNDIGGPWIFRGNWEVSFSALVTPIPRGPETHYDGYVMGIRRNLIHTNWRATPFAEFRAGLGNEDAKGPKGVLWAQGQDFAFTLMMDSGLRYRISPKYAIWAGVQWMHISNLYMSEPRYLNYGINVYGPTIGIDIALRNHRRGQVR